METNDFYGVRLNNYFSPSFCSSYKMYFGTLNDIKVFIESLECSEQNFMIRNAFKRYLLGETNVTYEAAYVQQKLIEDVELIAECKVKLGQTAWKFLNVWYSPQYMEFDSAIVRMALIKYESRYLRVIKASVRGLRTSPEANRPKERWIELTCGFWGHPGILSSSGEGNIHIVYSNLYMKEREYATKEEAMGKFRTDGIRFNCFCEDVFGNG